MALMGVEIQRTAVPAIAAGANAVFAHGLRGAPDAVLVQYVASKAVVASWYTICAVIDANNVTLYNDGNHTSGDMVVCAMRFHSIIQ